ncbi:MAG: DPP IV N-terminal domain-containing protein, partial [Bacteroidota bacterium]
MKRYLSFLSVLSLSLFILPAQVNVQDDKISLEEIWLTPFYFPDFAGEFRWMNDDQYYSVLEDQELSKYSIESEAKVATLLDIKKVLGEDAQSIQSYDFSKDEDRCLLYGELESIYRRSSKEVVYAVDIRSQEYRKLQEGAKISNAQFSPDGKKVAYVYENNVYYYDWDKNETVGVSTDGEINAIINGATDWVYEEEFAYTRAFDWSEDSKYLAYIKFDEREVPEWTMTMYGDLYPELYQFKYPKAGEKNSKISIHIYGLEDKKTGEADLGDETDIYVARMSWTPNNELAMMHMNRLQNELNLLLYNPTSKNTRTILTEKSETYVREASDDKMHFLKEDKGFLWLSEEDGYQHIYHKGVDGSSIAQLTQGEFEVSGILGIDEENEWIYFLSTEDSPLERHLYRINFKGKKKKKLSTAAGKHSITASSALNY